MQIYLPYTHLSIYNGYMIAIRAAMVADLMLLL